LFPLPLDLNRHSLNGLNLAAPAPWQGERAVAVVATPTTPPCPWVADDVLRRPSALHAVGSGGLLKID